MIRLETKRLILRDHMMDDFNEYFNLISNPDVMYYLPKIFEKNHTKAKKSFISIIEDANKRNRKNHFWGIFLRSNQYIGEIGYSLLSNGKLIEKTVDLGYFLDIRFWKKGFASEAVSRILEFAFLEDDVKRVEAGCAICNTSSKNVLSKNGFREKSIKKYFYYISGKWHDRVEYTKSIDDYLVAKEKKSV